MYRHAIEIYIVQEFKSAIMHYMQLFSMYAHSNSHSFIKSVEGCYKRQPFVHISGVMHVAGMVSHLSILLKML